MNILVTVAVAYAAFFLGHYTREIKDILLTIRNRIRELKIAQDAAKPPVTGFAEPMTKAEMIAQMEKDKIDLLNQ